MPILQHSFSFWRNFFLLKYFKDNMNVVQRLTKPSLVDLLRMCDKNRWCSPRIRYASIRSKPELCRDLIGFFNFDWSDDMIIITPKREVPTFPELKYHVKDRLFHWNGEPFDCARVSRARPQFSHVYKEITLHFGTIQGTLGSDTCAAASLMFPGPG